MFLKFITGGTGSGKSELLYELITENAKLFPESRSVVIVPEQFSYNIEKTLISKIGALGINGIEVTTFSRLVSRYINTDNNINTSGKMMLICRALSETDEENSFFLGKNMPGFIDSIYDLFSEFKHYGILPDDLSISDNVGKSFAQKLNSIKDIYAKYLENFAESFTDSDDNLSRLANLAGESDIFKNTFFYIDNYDNFMPRHYEIISAMLSRSNGVYITLGIPKSSDRELFSPIEQTKNRLLKSAQNACVPAETMQIDRVSENDYASDIEHLLKNWESKQKYGGSCENIEIFTARDAYSESEHIASEIISLVRDKGMRFRDIGVICGDLSQYLHIITSVFPDYDIPFFTDEKMAVSQHPITKTVLSLFNIIEENWSYNSVFSYLRSGYIYEKSDIGIIPINQEDVDLLDIYVSSHGIRGKKAWFSEWTDKSETIFDDVLESRVQDEYNLEQLNTIRKKITAPFEAFLQNKGRTALAIASAVYDFMCAINLYDGILYECEQLENLGLRNESNQLKQVWNTITETLDQVVKTAGKGSISRESFALYFKSGLSAGELSIIPSGLDRVSLGTVSRNSPSRVRALFVIGCTYGVIPASSAGQSLLTASDRELLRPSLSRLNKELAPDGADNNALERLKLYRVISTAKEKLYISYPASDSEGSAIAPSSFISDLKDIFPDIKESDNIISQPTVEELISSQKRGFYHMEKHYSTDRLWKKVYEYYSELPEYKEQIKYINIYKNHSVLPAKLSADAVEMLFGKNKKYSITALEKYNRCPFAYYIEKGLHAAEEKSGKIEKSHIGSLIHAAVCEYCTEVEKGAQSPNEIRKKWEELTPDSSRAIIDGIMENIRTKISARSQSEAKQAEYMLKRCGIILLKSAENIRKSIISGGYTSVCREKDFEVRIDWKKDSVTLYGIIDRIDVMELAAENKVSIRVIDYKSGHKKFSLSAICNGLDMQLVLYSLAAAQLYEQGLLYKSDIRYTPQISGIFYNLLADDRVSISENKAELAKREQKKMRRMDGIIVLDDTDDDNVPKAICDMDRDFIENRSSDFLNVSLKTDNTLSQASQVTTESVFGTISDYMKKSVIDADRRISNGDISINPYKSNTTTACTYCNFKEVCLFDPHHDRYRCLINNSEKAIEHMTKEVSDDEKLD